MHILKDIKPCMHATLQDLTELPHLHEPGVISALSSRYEAKDIYTSVGGYRREGFSDNMASDDDDDAPCLNSHP